MDDDSGQSRATWPSQITSWGKWFGLAIFLHKRTEAFGNESRLGGLEPGRRCSERLTSGRSTRQITSKSPSPPGPSMGMDRFTPLCSPCQVVRTGRDPVLARLSRSGCHDQPLGSSSAVGCGEAAGASHVHPSRHKNAWAGGVEGGGGGVRPNGRELRPSEAL